jgi:hypothetical protein
VTNEHDYEALEAQVQTRRLLDRMLKIIDGIEHENKIERDKILFNQLISNMKGEEFMKNVDKLKELDFAEGLIL